MKKGILALVLVLLVSMFTQPCLAAEAKDLVTFDSYDARKYDSNGIRVIYTFDTTTLAELEKDYNVSVGVLLSADVTESTYETEMVIGKAKIDTTFYSTEKGYVGKYYEKADGNKEFVYAVTYNDTEKTEDKITKAVSARAYVKLVSKTSGEEEIQYIDSDSKDFGKALSMKELAENFVATTDKNYPILQRLLNSTLKEMLINNISIDKFSVTGTDGAEVSEAIREKLGYSLPFVGTPYFADSYISAGEDNSLADNVLYKITADGAVINIGYNSASKISAFGKFKDFLKPGGSTVSGVTETIKEKAKYTVTFNANGGASNSSQQVTEGEKATKPEDPTREGYTFAGWYNEVAGTTAFDFDSAITEPKTVYAKWTANTYTLSFDTDGGNTISSKTVTYDSAIGSLSTPTKAGYTFAGWTVDGETVDANTVYKYASDKTAKAVWGTNKYTLSFDTDGGSAVTSKEVTFNVAIGSLSTPTKTGYTFAGWTIDGENIDADATYKYTSNKTAKATWTANTYTLSFDTDGGNTISSKTVTYNSAIGTLSTPTRAGYTFTGWTIDGTSVTSSTVYTYTTNKTAKANWNVIKYRVTYGDGANDYVEVAQGESFTLPVVSRENYTFLGYFTDKNVQVTDAEGKKLSTYSVTSNITVSAKFESGANSEEGQLLGNHLKAYYKSTGFAHKISRNPWDLVMYDGKLYVGGGYYGGSWNSAPPMIAYDIEKEAWENADITVKMYEAFDADSTTNKWYELPATKSNSNNVANQSLGVIPVTTDCEISGFRLIGGKPFAIGADSINGNTWANGTVSTSAPTDGQKYVVNNLGNYYTVEEDENGSEGWVEYRNYVLHGANVYDVVEIDYNGAKTLMFAVGAGGTLTPAKILTNKATRSYLSPKFYLKDGTLYSMTSGDKGIYNFFETSEGLFAYFAYENGSVKKIFKYSFTNNEHRFDEVRDVTVDSTSSADFRTYIQNDVDKNGAEVTDRRLWTGYMKSATYNGYAYITTGNLYKAKTFDDITAISVPNNAVVTDLLEKDGRLFALGFVKTNEATNEYKNYIWVVNASDRFTQIREFDTVGAYALSFEKDAGYFYVGLGGPTTHITTSVANVGNILKLSYSPLPEEVRYTVTFNANGGTPNSSQSVVEGTTVTRPANPTRTGYTFAGWYNEAAGTTAFDFSTPITGTRTLYAKWTTNGYTLSFDTDGGSSVSSKNVAYNTAIGTLATPTKAGYTFAGWTIDGTTVTSSTVYTYTSNKTAVANWTVNTYTLSFNTDGGSAVSSKSVTYNSAIGTLATPTKAGYTFAGWTIDGTSVTSSTVYTYTANKTAVANWNANGYTLSFNTDGGSAVSSKGVTYNSAIGTLSTPTKAGYTFAGWTIDGTSVTSSTVYTYTSNKTAVANWTANTYTLSFNTDGGSSVSSKSVTYNTAIGTLATPTKTGYTFTGWTIDGTAVTSSTVYTYTTNKTAVATWRATTVTYRVTYGDGANEYVDAVRGASFTLPVVSRIGYEFLGYFTEADVQVTDAEGKSLSTYVLSSNITVVAKYNRVPTEADSANGQLLGNPLKLYYKSATSYMHKMSRNIQDLAVYDGKVYIGGGSYDGGWNSAPPISVYDTAAGTWGNVDFTVKMYEAFDPDSTTKKWYELPATKSNSNNVSNQNVGIIPVTTDCEISNFKFINGKPIALGADSINGNTWADGTVSTNTTTTQKYAANNLGNYYTVEEDENGNERWVEYRNHVLHGTHVYDVIEVDYNGSKALMFALGTSGVLMPVKIQTNKNTKTYLTAKFYLKDGSSYDGVNSNNRVYNFFKTDEGIFAYYAHQGGVAKKIFKYNVVNGEHRFDEVRDISFGTGTNQTRLYTQSDVNSSGNAITSRRLWTDFMRTETYNGYAYYTTGYLYKTKTFENSETTAISAPNSAIISDLAVRDGKLYALGFVKTNTSTNEYTNYIWSIDANDRFTQIRTFNTVSAYALSFDKDEDYFYVGLGGPSTYTTASVGNVGNVIMLSYEPLTSVTEYTVTFNANGGTPNSSQSVVEGSTATRPANPTRTGYTFAGWYNEAAGTTAFDFSTPITGTRTLYARWTANTYTLSFNTDGGSSVSSKSVTYNSAIGTLATPTKSGYTFAGWTIDGTAVTSSTVYRYTSNKTAVANWNAVASTYRVTYGTGANEYVSAAQGASFTLPVSSREGYTFLGYFTSADVQVTDATGKSLSTYVLSSNITVEPKFQRIPTAADTATGQLLGNPLMSYYKSTSFLHKLSRNPWDLMVYDGKVYIGGGSYDGGWNSAPPVNTYDIDAGTWDYVNFTTKMYEAFDPDSTTKKWYELPATSSNSNNVAGGIKNIPVTTDCEIANFRFINGKPIILGGDSINGNTWADGTVSTSTPTDGQKSVANNLGNYYTVEEDENGNERWVEYRNHILHAAHVYDVVEIDHNGGKALMFALGTGSANMPIKIQTNKDTKSYSTVKFYLRDGSSYDSVNNNNRVYNLIKTEEGIFAYYAHQTGTIKKIFKYNFTNNQHRFDEVRDITIASSSSSNLRTYVQSDVNKNGTTINTRRLWTDFMRTETFNGYGYITTGYLYKTKSFNDIRAISTPNSAIISDLTVRDGKLYALGFVRTNTSTNAYTNYIWSIDENDNFTQIRSFTSTGAYALSFDKDDEFFYVGLGGPTTHITTSVTNVGNVLKFSINPVN